MSDTVQAHSKVDGETVFYDYLDESGKLVFQVIRKPGKKFLQRRPAQKGEKSGAQQARFHDDAWWIYSLAGVRPIPYQVKDLKTSRKEIRVVIVEGEKDADNLAVRDKSLVATTMPGGAAHKWEDAWSQ